MKTDRTVHAKFTSDREVFHIVRYDRAGKWFIESPLSRRPVTIQKACDTAAAFGAEIFYGLPGGSSFDRKMRAR